MSFWLPRTQYIVFNRSFVIYMKIDTWSSQRSDGTKFPFQKFLWVWNGKVRWIKLTVAKRRAVLYTYALGIFFLQCSLILGRSPWKPLYQNHHDLRLPICRQVYTRYRCEVDHTSSSWQDWNQYDAQASNKGTGKQAMGKMGDSKTQYCACFVLFCSFYNKGILEDGTQPS